MKCDFSLLYPHLGSLGPFLDYSAAYCANERMFRGVGADECFLGPRLGGGIG